MKEFQKSELNKVIRGVNRATYNIDTVSSILDAGFIGFISYTYQSKAITIPMAYGRMGNKIYLHGSKKNRMLLTLLQNKAASITIMHLDGLVLARSGFHHSVNYRSATLFGTLSQLEDPIKKEEALKCIVDQMIPKRWEKLRPMTEKEFNSTLVVEMVIETASAKVRDEGAIDEKNDMNLPIWAGVIPIKQVAEFPESDTFLSENIKIPKHVLNYYQTHKAQ
ncbi:pyridoxamine 5'-phosphate oxidase family protein [Tamlana sp. 2201CG12-4]|uniref:pyridoxamine 5'-phosphate oxidase family protein n=1 Tax=Tamlana sp. 2201CG12-4 TaxID=3112582 RepID=UPI002DB87BB0|nr:pyridoxamine 5'-phosphate oxidase family protein [Tamlana sp. 2201CG12-4]MEC3905393.1 pyridoxamine 5'-phosphate oxidase family protein [Tamlana sp. 2201CG12-4]